MYCCKSFTYDILLVQLWPMFSWILSQIKAIGLHQHREQYISQKQKQSAGSVEGLQEIQCSLCSSEGKDITQCLSEVFISVQIFTRPRPRLRRSLDWICTTWLMLIIGLYYEPRCKQLVSLSTSTVVCYHSVTILSKRYIHPTVFGEWSNPVAIPFLKWISSTWKLLCIVDIAHINPVAWTWHRCYQICQWCNLWQLLLGVYGICLEWTCLRCHLCPPCLICYTI